MKLLELKPAKTYAAAIKVTQDYPQFEAVVYVVAEGRFYPLCVGQNAVTAGTHFATTL